MDADDPDVSMTEANGLLPIVLGIGLTVLSATTAAADRGRGERSQWHAPLFGLAVLLVGFALVGAALFELGSAIESGRRLSPTGARVENRLIIALALLVAGMAAHTVWRGFVRSGGGAPWERGPLDVAAQLSGFATAIVLTLGVGVIVDDSVIATRHVGGATASLVIGAILLIGLGLAWTVLRLMTGGNPSPRAFMRSRHQQVKLLDALANTSGSWRTMRIRAVEALEPPLELAASIWVTPRGWYLRGEDANQVVRYHRWAANHAIAPVSALHRQRVTVFVGPRPSAMRGMRITCTPRRWLWRVDAIRSHRLIPAPAADASCPERAAGLVYISHEQLREAGLEVIDRPAAAAELQVEQAGM